MVEIDEPARAFEALGHEARLAVLKLLIPAGVIGITAGMLAETLGLAPSALSFHLNRLAAVGLVESRREGVRLYYVVRYGRLTELVRFLVDDCCAAAPAGCLPDCPGVNTPGPCGCSAGRQDQPGEASKEPGHELS